MANPLLDQVHVLVEAKGQPIPTFTTVNPRNKESVISKRPSMGDYIQYACDHLWEMGHRIIFTNSDIFFDSTLDYFTKISDKVFDETFYAISRWRLDSTGKDIDMGAPGTPLGMTTYSFPRFGSYWAENRLLYEVRRQHPKIKLVNPYKDVRTIHMHDSGRRGSTWSDRVNEGKGLEVSEDP
ncbi:hypothetical protein BGZ49_002290 [Haplosporangium sp. Z 27]|nr:hypothetical protein BGZ49_002290 [Haplosporangium sp. Z 27]